MLVNTAFKIKTYINTHFSLHCMANKIFVNKIATPRIEIFIINLHFLLKRTITPKLKPSPATGYFTTDNERTQVVPFNTLFCNFIFLG